jgi:L-fucose isomerase-like protein
MAMKYKVTPCITHSLLKDEAFPSVCEGDVNVFFSMALQMYLADRSAHMGNTVVHDVNQNLLSMNHDVPALKMKGFNQPDLPYNLVHFTERGWGPTMRYDFTRDKGDVVTFCRMTPMADKLLVVKGEMESGNGMESWGCSLNAVIKVKDARKYYKKAMQTGHHFSLIYGDYTQEMEQLAEILGIDFEIV